MSRFRFDRIINRQTRRDVAGLKVEAWDKDLIFDRLIASAMTNDNGNIQKEFDKSYFEQCFAIGALTQNYSPSDSSSVPSFCNTSAITTSGSVQTYTALRIRQSRFFT